MLLYSLSNSMVLEVAPAAHEPLGSMPAVLRDEIAKANAHFTAQLSELEGRLRLLRTAAPALSPTRHDQLQQALTAARLASKAIFEFYRETIRRKFSKEL